LPNGVAPSRRQSPSRSSPLLEGGREGKKVGIIHIPFKSKSLTFN
jgi:hypothetical protein